jgi:NADPH2:quinone reductase
MRRVAHAPGGGPEVLRLEEAPVPRPESGEILVRVFYAGVNRPDILQRSGRYPPPPDASPFLGRRNFTKTRKR